MKLAEALMMRSDLQTKLSELQQRILLNTKVQEGDAPSEDPAILLGAYNHAHKELVGLVQKILKTNALTEIGEGKTITDLITERDLIQKKRIIYSNIAREASDKQVRYSNSEIKTLSLLNASDIQKEADDMAKRFREIDILIQSANWQTDVIE